MTRVRQHLSTGVLVSKHETVHSEKVTIHVSALTWIDLEETRMPIRVNKDNSGGVLVVHVSGTLVACGHAARRADRLGNTRFEVAWLRSVATNRGRHDNVSHWQA
jgi:hypothetical protein